MNKKGQITLESLLLYGVAILVVLLAVGALTYFGILDLGRLLPDRCNLASAGTLSCDEWAVSSADDGTVSLGLRNIGARSLDIRSATFTPDGAQAVACTLEIPVDEDGESQYPRIQSGQIRGLVLDCDEGTIEQSPGQKLRGNLEIVFRFSDGAIDNPVGGQLIATVAQ